MNEKKSSTALFIIALITILSLIPLRNLRFDFNIEKLFPQGDPELAFYKKFQQQFQSQIDDEFIFIGLTSNKGIFQQDFLQKTDSLTKFVSKLNNIINVYSLTKFNLIFFDGQNVEAKPLLHIQQPSMYKDDSAYLFQSPEYRDLLVSKDGHSIAIAAFNKQHLSDHEKDILLNSIKDEINELHFDNSYLNAKIRIERTYVTEIQKNLTIYLIISLSFIAFSLYLLFRSFKAIIGPMAIIMVSMIWTLSIIALTGNSLDIITSLLPPILAAICMSDIIHISTKYIEELRTGKPKLAALKTTFKEVGLATFFTCLTVAIGFFTLSITNVLPIKLFGIYAGVGILVSFLITVTSLFSFFTIYPPPSIAKKRSLDKKWTALLAWCLKNVIRHKYKVLSIVGVLVIVSIYFATKIEINSSLLQEIPRKNPILKDYKFVEQQFAGTRPFEMALTVKKQNQNFFDLAMMKKVEELEKYLEDSCGVGYVITPLSLFKGANKSFHNGDPSQFVLPASPAQVQRFYEAIQQTEFADEMQHYMVPDGSRIRISGRLPDLNIKQFAALSKKFDQYFQSKDYPQYFSYEMTGSAVLLDKIVYYLTNNLFTGIYMDIIIISLIALFLLRHWTIVLIILIPNTIPLVFMAAVMGIMHINLKADTSVIFAVALAIAVDDTIHFLSQVRIELAKGVSLQYAVKRSYLTTGKAIIITAMVLITGFLTLLFSSFGGTFYIGLLISICLFTAVMLDLTILPILLLFLYKKKIKINNVKKG